MKKTVFITCILFFVLLFQSCILMGPSVKGDGNVTEETRRISGFEKLDASAGLEVFLISDSSEYVVVEADDNLHQDIKTVVDRKTLKVYTENRIRWAKAKHVKVHYKKLTAIESSSGATVRSESPVWAKHITLRASSGSHQYLELDARKLEGHCSSGAHVYLSGKCEAAALKASSGAHLKGEHFRAHQCEADVSSGAHLWINVRDELQAEASSGGQIYYSGEPSETSVRSSSGGNITRNQ